MQFNIDRTVATVSLKNKHNDGFPQMGIILETK